MRTGLSRYSRKHDDTAMRRDKDWQTELMAEKLKKRFARYENFSMTYIGTHEKVLCIDERYTLVGSYNLLSYDGGEKEMFQGYHFRFEGGVMNDDAEFAKHVIKEIECNIASGQKIWYDSFCHKSGRITAR